MKYWLFLLIMAIIGVLLWLDWVYADYEPVQRPHQFINHESKDPAEHKQQKEIDERGRSGYYADKKHEQLYEEEVNAWRGSK